MSGSALVIAHPGHELRLYGWVARTRPHVFVLTDGSGRSGRSRLRSTTEVLVSLGARPGSVYGRYSDAEIYRYLMNGDAKPFVALADEIADAFSSLRITDVVADPLQGYNPTHDLCRCITDAAVKIARSRGCAIRNYDFALVGPAMGEESGDEDVVRFELSEHEIDAKEAAARGYGGLAEEVEGSLRLLGREAFRVECLRQVSDDRIAPPQDPPIYELVGEHLVAGGRYERPLRYREHVLPVATAIAGAAARGIRCAS